jgi:outer membrane murein-binding lipoprotein Lpp
MSIRVPFRLLTVASGALMLAGCGGDPALMDAIAWHGQLGSLMAENTTLAYRFQDLAVKVKKSGAKINVKGVADLLGGDLQSAAGELAQKVPAARPETPALATLNDELEEIWTERAANYGKVVEAWRGEDRSELESVAEANLQNKLAEEWWLERTNAALEPHKLRVELYPVAAAE